VKGKPTTHPTIKTYALCKKLHCLPSQLEEEDLGILDEFQIISNIEEKEKEKQAKKGRNK
jgi:hypothetical protein